MEEDIRKQGMLYLQQQRFGKKWKRVCAVLYRESSCSISRLEFFECKDGAMDKSDKSLRKQQEHKKVIRLSDCIRVSEAEVDGCPRDTGPFLLETTDKIYMFAADSQQVDEWTRKLCELAFPMSWAEPAVTRGGGLEDKGMEDNSLYSGRDTARDFRVCVRRTEASERCRLRGDGVLRAHVHALHLLHKSGDVAFTWPYRYLRRFGRDKSSFSFEAGRRCESGEGSFEFDTKQGNALFQAVEAAIHLQRTVPHRQTSAGGRLSPETPPLPSPRSHIPQSPAVQAKDSVYSVVHNHPSLQTGHRKDKDAASQQRPQLSGLEPPVDKVLTAVKSLTLDALPRKNQVKTISSCPLPHAQMPPPEPEYSLPFDAIAKNVMADILGSHRARVRPPGAADPLYDSIDETKVRSVFPGKDDALGPTYGKVDHIYDEPEGRASPASVYDDPEEMRGEAWRIMGTAVDPKGHEYPYNPRVDDYAVPRPPKRAFPVAQRTHEEEDEEGEEREEQQVSPYNNLV